jgi:murein L,D-transpeptidase YcbB/YkuD
VASIQNGLASNAELVRFDLALTVSLMRYVSDVSRGKVDPASVHPGLAMPRLNLDLAAFLENKVKNVADVTQAFDSVEPPFDGYWRTQRGLQTYIALARSVENHPDFTFSSRLRKGDRDPGIPALARLLQRLGDLPAEYRAITNPSTYDDVLQQAMKHFQLRHGLDPSGRIDKATLRRLNTPISHRIRQLQLTLERWRWVRHEFAAPPIVVNIPEFRLRALNDRYSTEIEMNVVVGQAYRHRTPIFTAEMTHVIFHPYWNVPLSIQRDELIPEIMRDRSYLQKHGYEIVSSETSRPVVAEPSSVLAQLRSGKLAIRQIPGPENALGRVKFIFPNENDVYMHDTPAQALFSKARRDFSHGCIRVESPEDLAVWVLRHNPEWPSPRIKDTLEGLTETRVELKRRIPVLIVYATAVVLQNNEVRFFEDIYGHDAALEKQLARAYRSNS